VVNHEGNNFVGINAGAALVFPVGYPNGDNDYVGTADGCDIGSVELALIVPPHSFEDGFED